MSKVRALSLEQERAWQALFDKEMERLTVDINADPRPMTWEDAIRRECQRLGIPLADEVEERSSWKDAPENLTYGQVVAQHIAELTGAGGE